jgi:hypothetical protein
MWQGVRGGFKLDLCSMKVWCVVGLKSYPNGCVYCIDFCPYHGAAVPSREPFTAGVGDFVGPSCVCGGSVWLGRVARVG